MEKKQGLNKLNERLYKLEQVCEDTDDLLDILTKKQKSIKKAKLQELNDVYMANLSDTINELSKDNFFNILSFTIQFSEENIDSISQILLTKKSDELLILVVIDFMTKIYNGEYTDKFIENCIIGIQTLKNTNKYIIDEPKNIEKKKSFFRK